LKYISSQSKSYRRTNLKKISHNEVKIHVRCSSLFDINHVSKSCVIYFKEMRERFWNEKENDVAEISEAMGVF